MILFFFFWTCFFLFYLVSPTKTKVTANVPCICFSVTWQGRDNSTGLVLQVQSTTFESSCSCGTSFVPSSCDRLGSHNKGLACVCDICAESSCFPLRMCQWWEGYCHNVQKSMTVNPSSHSGFYFVVSVVSPSLWGIFLMHDAVKFYICWKASSTDCVLWVGFCKLVFLSTKGLIVISTFSWCCNFYHSF